MKVYIYQAALYCESCALRIMRPLTGRVLGADYEDSGHYPQGPYADGGGEADYPQHCDACGEFLENPLTDDGRAYVADAIEDVSGDPNVLKVWKTFYT